MPPSPSPTRQMLFERNQVTSPETTLALPGWNSKLAMNHLDKLKYNTCSRLQQQQNNNSAPVRIPTSNGGQLSLRCSTLHNNSPNMTQPLSFASFRHDLDNLLEYSFSFPSAGSPAHVHCPGAVTDNNRFSQSLTQLPNGFKLDDLDQFSPPDHTIDDQQPDVSPPECDSLDDDDNSSEASDNSSDGDDHHDHPTTDTQQLQHEPAAFNMEELDIDDDSSGSDTQPTDDVAERQDAVPELQQPKQRSTDDIAVMPSLPQRPLELSRQNSRSDTRLCLNNKSSLSGNHTLPKVQLKKKCVSFADDCGLKLLAVKEFHEKPDEPPFEDSNLKRSIATLTGQECQERLPASSWRLDFAQPISDYVKFYQTIERNGVSLENALIRNDVHQLIGTVRVRNYCFEKHVNVRYTHDDWASADLLQAAHESGNEFFDIFKFELPLPMTDEEHERVQFCVAYTTPSHGEKWDSNGGANYKLISQEAHDKREEERLDGYWNMHVRTSARRHRPVRDATALNINDWAHFSSWNNLTRDTPYY